MYSLDAGSIPAKGLNEVVMRQAMNENLPGIGSYWLNPEKKRVRVLMVANKRAKGEQASIYPLTVVFTDGLASIDQAQFWSLPLEQWQKTMKLIPPSDV